MNRTRVLAALPALALVALLGRDAAARPITGLDVDVEVPHWTSGKVYVACDQRVNGAAAWTADALALTKDARGRWLGTIPCPAGTKVQWKVTRGSWATVEKGPLGDESKNRSSTAEIGKPAFAHVYHWGDDRILPPPGRRVDLGQFASRSLDRGRRVVAWLPLGYDDAANATRTYPVLYALDGQNLLDPRESFGGVAWELDAASDAHVRAGRAPFIAICVDNTSGRIDEYTPSFDPSVGGGGKLDGLYRFLRDELKPAVDQLCRTKKGPEDTAILGSSLGGLAALTLGWQHPDRFGRVGAVSPSLWWNNDAAKAMIRAAVSKPALKIWLDMGTNEGGSPAATLQRARDAATALRNVGFTSADLGYYEARGAGHNEGSWQQRLPRVLQFLFP